MRALLALAAVAVLVVGAGCAIGDDELSAAVAAHFEAAPYNPRAAFFAGAMMQNAIIACRNKRLEGKLTGFAQSARCSNEAILAIYKEVKYPYMDLISLIAADRLAASEKIDSGQWTEKQAQVQMAELGERVNSEIARRESTPQVARSQDPAARSQDSNVSSAGNADLQKGSVPTSGRD
jgi:hypothetical protein